MKLLTSGFKLNALGLQRAQLMGVATLMILDCHASSLQVLKLHWLAKVMASGYYGVISSSFYPD